MAKKSNIPKVGVVGIGMVGKPLARYFEEIQGMKRGTHLFLYDVDEKKGCGDDVSRADIVFICVPTPRSPKDGSCDLSIVDNAVKRAISNGGIKVIVMRSTVPPGTTESFQKKYPKHKFLFNPEFLTESRAWEDMIRPDRQIIGYTNKSLDAAHIVLSLLPKAPFMSPWGINTYMPTRITATEAEFIKYASNVYFVRKINWANALAKASEKLGVDYENVRKGMSADHRIGDSHLDVSHGNYRGWGGNCFPKDTSAFIQFAKDNGLEDVHGLLLSDWKFNEFLLKEQGLTVTDVSQSLERVAERLGKSNKTIKQSKKH